MDQPMKEIPCPRCGHDHTRVPAEASGQKYITWREVCYACKCSMTLDLATAVTANILTARLTDAVLAMAATTGLTMEDVVTRAGRLRAALEAQGR